MNSEGRLDLLPISFSMHSYVPCYLSFVAIVLDSPPLIKYLWFFVKLAHPQQLFKTCRPVVSLLVVALATICPPVAVFFVFHSLGPG